MIKIFLPEFLRGGKSSRYDASDSFSSQDDSFDTWDSFSSQDDSLDAPFKLPTTFSHAPLPTNLSAGFPGSSAATSSAATSSAATSSPATSSAATSFATTSSSAAAPAASGGGSGLEIIPTFDSTCTVAFEQCVYAAIAELHALFSNNLTINLSFSEDHNFYVTDSKGNKTYLYGNTGTVAHTQSPNGISVSYATLKAALPASDVLPATDPNSAGGDDYVITDAYARMLGLSTTAPSTDSSIWFNEYYNWSYNQDCVNAMVHEITEAGMGRVGGLGDQNSHWSTMDLFRFDANGKRDYSDGRDNVTTYFSADGGATLSDDNFWNEYSGTNFVTGNDTADFQQNYAVFGGDITGETIGLTQDEINELKVLGGNLTLPQDVYQGTGTNWETIGRWSIGSMPAEPEDAYIRIIAGGQVSVDYNVFVNSIGVSAGSDLDVGNSALFFATNGTKLSSLVTSSVGSGNDGLIDIETNAVFSTGDEIANRGTIELGDPINGLGFGKLNVVSALTFVGGGTIQLGAKQTNSAFYGTGQIDGAAVTNIDNTITGGGQIEVASLDNQSGGTIASSQINAAALHVDAVNFTNEGSLIADNNSTLELGETGVSRTLTNSGSIYVGTGTFATLDISGTLTIAGSGQLILNGVNNSLIMGTGKSALNTLVNDSEIDAVASGDIGFVYSDSSTYLFLQNRGSIVASAAGAVLTLNTGSYTVDSEGGLLNAYGGGTLLLSSEIDVGNNGELEASAGGTIDVFQEVVSEINAGQAVVQAGGVMNIENNGEVYVPIDIYAASGGHPGSVLTLQTGGLILGQIDFHGGGEFDDQSAYAYDFNVNGTGGAIHLNSAGNTLTFTNASGPANSVFGSKETLDLAGAAVSAIGDDDVIKFTAGTQNVLTIQGGGDAITTSAGSTLTVGGNGAGGASDAVNGTNMTVTLSANSRMDLTGSDNAVTLGAGSNMSLFGSNDTITATTGDGIWMLAGTGDVMTGSGFSVYASSGNQFSVGGNGAGGTADYVNGAGFGLGVQANSRVNLTGSNDGVTMGAGSNLGLFGSDDTIAATTGDSVWMITGTGDVMTGSNFTVNAAVGNEFSVGGNGASGAAIYVNGAGFGVGIQSNSRVNLTGSNDGVTMGVGSNLGLFGSDDTIAATTGDSVWMITGTGDVMTGSNFTVNAANGNQFSVGGNGAGGAAIYVNGAGFGAGVQANSRVNLTGSNDSVTMGAGSNLGLTGSNDTISATTGDSVYLVAGTGDVVNGSHFVVHAGASTTLTVGGGSGDAVVAAANDTLTDLATGTLFDIGSNVGTLKIQDFGGDSTGVIDLLNGIGGYASAALAYAALTSDGAGGSLLSLGANGSIDFAGVAANHLSAANFKVG